MWNGWKFQTILGFGVGGLLKLKNVGFGWLGWASGGLFLIKGFHPSFSSIWYIDLVELVVDIVTWTVRTGLFWTFWIDLIGLAWLFMSGRNAGGPARTGASRPRAGPTTGATGLGVERTIINSFELLFDVETDLVDCVSELPELVPEHSVKTISSNANTKNTLEWWIKKIYNRNDPIWKPEFW